MRKMWSSGPGNHSRGRQQSTTVKSTTVVFTSTSVPEMPPAAPTSAVTAVQVAAQMPGAFSSRPTPSRSVTEADRQRALPPPPSARPPTGPSAVGKTPTPAPDRFDVPCSDPDCRQGHHSQGNDLPGENLNPVFASHQIEIVLTLVRDTSSVRRSRPKGRSRERWIDIRLR